MLPALKIVFLLFRGISFFDFVLLVLTSAAFLYAFRQRIVEALRWRGLQSLPFFVRMRPAAATVAAHCRSLQTSLQLVRRDADIRVEQRLAALDRLIIEADREIGKLQSALSSESSIPSQATSLMTFKPGPDFIEPSVNRSTTPSTNRTSMLTADQRAMVRDLVWAGHSTESIASLLNRSTAEIDSIVADGPSGGLADAA